jgi:hypothetical protein
LATTSVLSGDPPSGHYHPLHPWCGSLTYLQLLQSTENKKRKKEEKKMHNTLYPNDCDNQLAEHRYLTCMLCYCSCTTAGLITCRAKPVPVYFMYIHVVLHF